MSGAVRTYFASGVVFLSLIFYSTAASDEIVTVTYVPETLEVVAVLPELTASAYAVFDVRTGALLAAVNEEKVLPIASVTKLFTAATVVQNVPLDTALTVIAADVATEGRSGRLSAGEEYTVHELLFPLLLESSNDAAAALTRAREDFIKEMNLYTKAIGMTEAQFADASGLSDNNVASVKDLAVGTSYLYRTTPHIFDITQLEERVGPYVPWANNSQVLSEAYRGGKNGYTEAAGKTIVALFAEELTGGKATLGYVVLGSENSTKDLASLRAFAQTGVVLK